MKNFILLLIFAISNIAIAQKLEDISSIGKVGIDTSNPKATLDVDYKIKLNKLGENNKEKGKLLLINKDGFLVVNNAQKLTFAYLPLNVATIKVLDKASKERNDQLQKAFTIKDFDTKIPTSEYNIIITSASIHYTAFTENSTREERYFGINVDHSKIDNMHPENNHDGQAWAPQQVYNAFKKNGTWHIVADYEGLPSPFRGATIDPTSKGGYSFYWSFGILAIKNSYVEEIEVDDDISRNYGIKNYQYKDNNQYNVNGYFGVYSNNNGDDKGPLPE